MSTDYEKDSLSLPQGVLGSFAALKWQSDPATVLIALAGMSEVFAFERGYLGLNPPADDGDMARARARTPPGSRGPALDLPVPY